MNKELKVIQPNIAPLNTNHLWLNTDTNTIYKFGANGWEVINNAPYIVEEFTVNDIMTQSREGNPELTISRNFLDAMYKGVPIMVKEYPGSSATRPITVNQVDNPSKNTIFGFTIKHYNIEFRVLCFQRKVITGNKALPVTINTYNSIDWNENDEGNPGYIANRTHHLGAIMVTGRIGYRISVSRTGAHYVDNYKLLYNGKLYDLPSSQGEEVFISNYFKIIFLGSSVSDKTSTYTFLSEQFSESLPSQTFGIVSNIEDDGHKALDEFYLPDGAKPWKKVNVFPTTSGVYRFVPISSANITDGETVIRNKAIYDNISPGDISIGEVFSTDVIEFKVVASSFNSITIDGKCFWENGTKPQLTSGDKVIYSFLAIGGKIYASAKVFRALE